MLRRIVAARVGHHPAAEDLVQETLVRVLAARDRIEPGMLEPYAIVTARNVIATMWREEDRAPAQPAPGRRPAAEPERPDEDVLASRGDAPRSPGRVQRLDERDARTLLAHEVAGERHRARWPRSSGSTAGAVAAQLNRTRARLRVEYLLALEQAEPPTDRCRPVLLALSGGDRRRQREVDAARHLLECELCARLSEPLLDRGPARDDEVRIPITGDADIVAARQAGPRARRPGRLLRHRPHPHRHRGLRDRPQHRPVRRARRGRRRAARRAATAACSVVARDAGPGHPRRRAGARRRLQHLRRARAGPARRAPADGRVRRSPPNGAGTTVTMTKWLTGRTTMRRGPTTGAETPPDVPRIDRAGRGPAAARSWWRTCASTAPSCGRSGPAASSDAHLLQAMTPQEMAAETTSVYDNYVEVLETGSVEALQHYARDLSERIIPRGVETHEVVGIVLLLRDVLARSLFEKYQQRLRAAQPRCSTPTSRPPTGSPTPSRSASSTSASGSSGSSRTPSGSCPPRCCRCASGC